MKWHQGACLSATFLFFYALLSALHAGRAPVRFVRISPRVTISPVRGGFAATVWVDADDRNRLLRVAVVGDDFYRSSDIQLDGAHAAKAHEVAWESFVPCGRYEWTATTFSSTGEAIARAVDRSVVCESDGP